MAEVSYLIPEPKTEIGSETYLGTLLIAQNSNQYACKKRTDTEKWWAIGMIANNGTWWHPCIVSNVEGYSYSYSDGNWEDNSPLSNVTGSFEYNGTTFYVSFGAFGSNSGSAPASATVPIYTETTLPNITEAGKKLIELYKAAGGTIPGEKEEYPTSWVRKLIDDVWQKTFAFAHAKTVYTDYAHKKTLADKLSEIDTSLDGKANSTHTHTKSQITDFPTLGTASAKDVASTGNASTSQVVMGNDTRLSDARKASDVSAWAKASVKPSYSKSEVGLGNVDNTSDTSKPVSTAQQTAIDTAYANANKYTDKKVADLIGSAPETMDTLEEVAAAIQENKDVETALNAAIGTKANQTELDTHTDNSTIHITASERTEWNAAKTHADSTHARTDATKVEASSTNGNIKIDGTETTVYTHPSGTNPHGTTKSDVGLGNVDNTADVNKSVKSSKRLETYKPNSTTETYGDNYSVYAQWRDSSHVKMKCDNYTVEIDYATSAGSAANASKVNNHTVEANVPANAKFTDTNTWRGIQDNLTSDSTTDSLSANQGKILNDSKLMHETITTNKLDINTLTKTGIYHIKTTTCLNVPTNNHATLFVDNIVGTPYQIFMPDSVTTCMYKRTYIGNDTWTSWTELKFTDTDTWRPLGTTADTACAGNDSRLSNARAANGSGYVSELVGVQSNNTPYSYTEGNIIRAVWNTKSDNRWYLKAGDYGCRVSCADNADSVSWSNVSGKPSSMPASDVYSWAKASSKPSYSWSEITSKPSTFTPASHTHDYLPLSGGTVNGSITFGKNDNYGIFTSTNNYCSIGSSSAYFYRAYINNIYLENLSFKNVNANLNDNTRKSIFRSGFKDEVINGCAPNSSGIIDLGAKCTALNSTNGGGHHVVCCFMANPSESLVGRAVAYRGNGCNWYCRLTNATDDSPASGWSNVSIFVLYTNW